MGTLTAGQPRLAEYCDHKLPASCRLTSIPQCCACADERAHAATYSVYIDGIGFVPRGTRWQRYCWFCKEFWENRVRASGLRSGQTRIPEIPDQTAFLDRWYEFHRGYRTVAREDGREERVAVVGEDFKDVSPGFLPRTVEELRAGRVADDLAGDTVQHQEQIGVEFQAGPSLEDTLDQMFQAAAVEENDQQQPALSRPSTLSSRDSHTVQTTSVRSEHGAVVTSAAHDVARWQQDMNVTRSNVTLVPRSREYQARRIAALRRELGRMRNGIERVISGLYDLGEMPHHTEATGRLADLGRTLDAIDGAPSLVNAQTASQGERPSTNPTNVSESDRTLGNAQDRVEEARMQLDEARRNRDQAASELDLAESELRTSQSRMQQVQREQRTTENYLRVFGTREEMLAQGDQFESPIGGMFNRAYERFRAAEEVRRDERTLRRVLDDEARATGQHRPDPLADFEGRSRDVWGVPERLVNTTQDARQAELTEELAQEPRGELEEYYAMLRTQHASQQAPQTEIPERVVAGLVQDASELNATILSSDNFPQNMLNSVLAAREVRTAVSNATEGDALSTTEHGSSRESSEPSQVSDAEHIMMYLNRDEDLAARHGITAAHIQILLTHMSRGDLTSSDLHELDRLRTTPELVWGSRLPTARNRRCRLSGTVPIFVQNRPSFDLMVSTRNIECMAEVFMRSAGLRQRAPGLHASQQLRMLYRLQAGRREMEDVAILEAMSMHPDIFAFASEIYVRIDRDDFPDNARHQTLAEQRRAAARRGDHSRDELDAQRRATQAFAVAAGRTTISAGSTTLLEQLAERDAETRAAYDRLQQNGFVPEGNTPEDRRLRETIYRPLNLEDYASGSDIESELDDDVEAQGLDAKDTGRPDAKADEEMKVSMECRICYTQLAEIACLPCGHLVMCKWCSEQHSPVMLHDRTRPRRAAGCPLCRKTIRQKVRVFRA